MSEEGGWQYTKWNMTADEVVAASSNHAGPIDPNESNRKYTNSIVLLKAPYRSGELDFVAYFHFDQKSPRLIAVAIELRNVEKIDYLRASLISKYGNPHETKKIGSSLQIDTWHTRDKITLSFSSESATIKYEPRINADNQGL